MSSFKEMQMAVNRKWIQGRSLVSPTFRDHYRRRMQQKTRVSGIVEIELGYLLFSNCHTENRILHYFVRPTIDVSTLEKTED